MSPASQTQVNAVASALATAQGVAEEMTGGPLVNQLRAQLQAAAHTNSGIVIAPPPPPPAPPKFLQSLAAYVGSANPTGFEALATMLGGVPGRVMEFLDATSWATISNPTWFIEQWQTLPTRKIWGIPVLPTGSPNTQGKPASGTSLAQGATGAYNKYFAEAGAALVAGGQASCDIRLAWEFNWTGMAYFASPAEAQVFIEYMQQLYTTLKAVPDNDFQICTFNPTLLDQQVGDLANFYPGDNYTDQIGGDCYDQAWATYPGEKVEFQTILTAAYGLEWLASFSAAHKKPACLFEWGLGSGVADKTGGASFSDPGNEVTGGDDGPFITDVGGWFNALPNPGFITYYDVGQGLLGPTSNPNTLAALAALVKASQEATTAPA